MEEFFFKELLHFHGHGKSKRATNGSVGRMIHTFSGEVIRYIHMHASTAIMLHSKLVNCHRNLYSFWKDF